jgi:SEC-C motif-containing protein
LLISQKAFALSPEQLMRSRYSAYAINATNYIYQTYAKSSQAQQSVDDIATWANQTTWLKLIVHCASNFSLKEKTTTSRKKAPNKVQQENVPTVCFSAYYQHQGRYFLMKETSRFILEDNLWHYLDGEVSDSKELAIPKRNEQCFCQSKKKFKHCCGA